MFKISFSLIYMHKHQLMFHKTEFKIVKTSQRLGYTGEIENMFLNYIGMHEHLSLKFQILIFHLKKQKTPH